MKKKFIRIMISILILIMMLFSGCATTTAKNKYETPQSKIQKKQRALSGTKSSNVTANREERGKQRGANELLERYNNLHLKKNEIYLANNLPLQIDNYNFKDFSVANATITFIDMIGMTISMEVKNQYKLAKALFLNIPLKPKENWIRDVLVGKYFPDGSDLIISEYIFPVKKEAGVKADKLLLLITNITQPKESVKGIAKGEVKSSGYPNSLKNKLLYFLIFNNNWLVTPNNINNKNIKPKSSYSAQLKIVLSDIYIKDPILENDKEVLPMLETILADPSTSVAERTAARLNIYLYYLSQNKLDRAYKLIRDINANIPPGLNKSFINVIKIEAPNLLRILKTLETEDESFLSYGISEN